jgi:hypothetical protein
MGSDKRAFQALPGLHASSLMQEGKPTTGQTEERVPPVTPAVQADFGQGRERVRPVQMSEGIGASAWKNVPRQLEDSFTGECVKGDLAGLFTLFDVLRHLVARGAPHRVLPAPSCPGRW